MGKISLSLLGMMLAFVFFIGALYQVEEVFFYFSFVDWKSCWILSNAFSASTEIIM